MSQAEPQEQAQKDRRGQHNAGRAWGTPFTSRDNPRGKSPAREARRDAIIAEWTAAIGGPSALSAAEIALLRCAAELVVSPARSPEDRIRYANAISKILKQVGLVDRRGKPRSQPAPPNAFAGLVLSGEPR